MNTRMGSKFKISGLIGLMIVTGLFCILPHFHPEHYFFGMGYNMLLDFIFHGGYYFVITLLILAFYKGDKMEHFIVSILVFSFLLEILQAWVPGRVFSLFDFLSNGIGISAAALLIYTYDYIRANE